MADSEAVRQRRRRAHAAGDHSLCVRCDGLRPGADDVGDAEPCSDPVGELAALAGRLVAAHTADPANAMLARELRQTLLAMAPDAAPAADDVDKIRQEWEAGNAL
jgi:hypothetical protein